jgi:hypothetical protein
MGAIADISNDWLEVYVSQQTANNVSLVGQLATHVEWRHIYPLSP